MRHLAVAAVVVLLVNAQLTWWIVYALRENRTRLKLERELLLEKARLHALHVVSCLEHTRTMLTFELLAAAGPVAKPETPGVASVAPAPGEGPCTEGWFRRDGAVGYRLVTRHGCIEARIDRDWLRERLHPPEGLTVGPVDDGIPGVPLPPPLDTMEVRPAGPEWNALLDAYRRRILMVVSEGTFFAVMLLVVVWLLWKTVRREVELERQHQNFLSAITHELKSPLAAMRLSLETVLKGRADSTASVRFLENALQDTERLQSLVQKVLEVTRYGLAGKALTLRTTSLSDTVEEAVDRFRSRAMSAGARMHVAIRPGLIARADEEAFAIVVSNLLENAIKYGGTIPEVTVRLFAENGRAVLEVGDNGRGIAEEDVPFVFNRFFRGGNEMTRTTQGTGLGLHLVEQIVSGHGGTVQVASTGPEGTVFRVELPLVRIEDAETLESGREAV